MKKCIPHYHLEMFFAYSYKSKKKPNKSMLMYKKLKNYYFDLQKLSILKCTVGKFMNLQLFKSLKH